VTERHVEIREPDLRERRVDVLRPEESPQRERGAIVGDGDHRLERLVDRHDRARRLERAVLGDVLVLDRDRVRVLELAGVHAPLGLRQDAELVERSGDDPRLGVVGEEGVVQVRVGDPEPGPAWERGDKAVELLDEVGGARAGGAEPKRVGEDREQDDAEPDRPHHALITAPTCRCFSV
jgi:hypothetical protein